MSTNFSETVGWFDATAGSTTFVGKGEFDVVLCEFSIPSMTSMSSSQVNALPVVEKDKQIYKTNNIDPIKGCLPYLFHGFRHKYFYKISLDNMLYYQNLLYKF